MRDTGRWFEVTQSGEERDNSVKIVALVKTNSPIDLSTKVRDHIQS